MASTNPPLADVVEADKTLPSIPPSILATQANETMAPVASQESSPSTAENPFADPQAEPLSSSGSAAPTTPLPAVLNSTDAGDALRANIPQNGTAVQDFTSATTSDSLTVGPKPSSFNSTASTAPSSVQTGTTTLVSSTNGDAMTTATTNPFADPVPQIRVQEQTPIGAPASKCPSTRLPPTTPLHTRTHSPGIQNHHTRFLHPRLSSNPNSIAPTPLPKSSSRPLGSNRWTSVSAITNSLQGRSPLSLHAQGHTSTNSLAREVLARESARRQDELLASERAKYSASQPNLHEPHLRPSPSALRVAAELIRARDANVAYGGQAVLKSPVFWIAVLGVQCGLVSTSAAIATVIEASQHGDKVYVGAGRVFWLVISIIIFVLSAGAAWGVWMRKRGAGFGGGEEGVLRRLGCDEVGLLHRNISGDMEMGDLDPEGGSISSPRPSLRGRHRGPGYGSMPAGESLTSIRTRDPEWQALYPTPKELKGQKMSLIEALGETPVRHGAHGLHKESDRTRRYDEQRADPPPKARKFFDSKLTRSDKSGPLRSSPDAAPFVNTHPEHPSPYQPSSPASPRALLQQNGPYPSIVPLRNLAPSRSNSQNNSSPLTTNDLYTLPQESTPTHTHNESRVEVLSPLSSLTQSIQNASQSSLPAHHRPQYIHGHRVASEERVRSLRESLESRSRGNSNATENRDLFRVQSNTASGTGERIREFVVELELGGEDERVGRRRSRSVDVMLAEGSGSKSHSQKAREVLANVKGHFSGRDHHRGRSLGSVVREKMAKLKEAGVESDDPTPPLPLAYPTSPLRDRDEVFVVGDDSPIKTPTKPSRKSYIGSSSASSSPIKTPSKPSKAVLPPSPLSRKD